MQLWTIQTEGWLEDLQAKQVKYASYARVWHYFKPHYRWMARQMAERIGTDPTRCPTFAWFKYFGTKPRPDLRESGHFPRGTPGVRVELQVDPQQVLLSQFEMWHAVLNQTWLAENETQAKEFEALSEAGKLTRPIMEASWNRIFDLKAGDGRSWGKRSERAIQACLERVSIDQVRNVDHFIAR
ncbi:hypothetical protein Pan153_05130 [Gimesia panareensis]|uniref:DUF3841 domain-containing protein n=1 Tax=Gimesia panareensis TaxID=2527978 RepID=A0A518FHR6_9PLAN|nr:DUF3841 domain-containing protein [Gimesia panareensis]QDV15894.1 hypothetical protein Pan153_05130 [Gimesia panareensis]